MNYEGINGIWRDQLGLLDWRISDHKIQNGNNSALFVFLLCEYICITIIFALWIKLDLNGNDYTAMQPARALPWSW